MSDWLDGWARRAARPAHPTPGDTPPEPGPEPAAAAQAGRRRRRRDLDRRAHPVGGRTGRVSQRWSNALHQRLRRRHRLLAGRYEHHLLRQRLLRIEQPVRDEVVDPRDVRHEQRLLQQRVYRRRLPEGHRRCRVQRPGRLRLLGRRRPVHGRSLRRLGFDLLVRRHVCQRDLHQLALHLTSRRGIRLRGSTARRRLPSVTTGSRLSGFEGRAWTAGWTVGPRRPRPRVRDVRPATPRDHLG